jgi:hypothetical protein
MASGTFFSGKDGNVNIDGVDYPFSEWTFDIEIGEQEVTNFLSEDFWREFLNGFKKGEFTAKGPYDVAKAIPVLGSEVTITITIGGIYDLTGQALAKNCKFTQSIEKPAEFNFTARATGAWTLPS